MLYAGITNIIISSTLIISSTALPNDSSTLTHTLEAPRNISIPLFVSLEEFSRIVDISYCVGTTGIQQPFSCASRCDEFPKFELVNEFNTGPLMSDSCGYIALDHGSRTHAADGGEGRIIVAFRGTYSLANTIVDLSTVPQEYVPYPGNPSNDTKPQSSRSHTSLGFLGRWLPGYFSRHDGGSSRPGAGAERGAECQNCTVHSGFWQSWQNTRPVVLPNLEVSRARYPSYSVHLVGHSLGGAVAALAGLELDASGWKPTVTTFGEPKVGNAGLRRFIDKRFGLPYGNSTAVPGADSRYRRVTHVDDPVPLLPLQEWGYKPHAGEVYISKSALQPSPLDLEHCHGDEDQKCSAGSEPPETWIHSAIADMLLQTTSMIGKNPDVKAIEQEVIEYELKKRWGIPISSRYKMWQLFFAHRDYFWRLGLCVMGGDPSDWGRDKYRFPGSGDGQEENPQEVLEKDNV